MAKDTINKDKNNNNNNNKKTEKNTYYIEYECQYT